MKSLTPTIPHAGLTWHDSQEPPPTQESSTDSPRATSLHLTTLSTSPPNPLTEAVCRWLLVMVDDIQQAAAAADVARGCGATLAIRYRTLTVEELIA